MSLSNWPFDKYLRNGLYVLFIGFGGFVAWSLLLEVNGAVIVNGHVVVEARKQAVQHLDGGLVSALHVGDGDTVTVGSPIITLDGTELLAQKLLGHHELVEILAKMDRLHAEVKGLEQIVYRDELSTSLVHAETQNEILGDEKALFDARRATLLQTSAQLNERKIQTEAVISGREKQLTALKQQLLLIRADLAAQEQLLSRGLTEMSRVSALRREAARLEGGIGELESSIAEARSSIAGLSIERLRQQATFHESAQAELRNMQPKEAELRERLRVIEMKLDRLVLRAPMSGRVIGLQIHTVGGVIAAGAEVAAIIPQNVPIVLSMELDPRQIDRVQVGQGATVRFPNFNSRVTPELEGEVSTLSADTVSDPTTGRRYFLTELKLTKAAEKEIEGQALLPGMPVEAFIRTDARTPASFLLKPIADYWAYAMRER